MAAFSATKMPFWKSGSEYKKEVIMIARFLIATCSLSHINSTHLVDPTSKTIKLRAKR